MFYVPTKIEVYQWYFKENKSDNILENTMVIRDFMTFRD